jgi:hypothetical protein
MTRLPQGTSITRDRSQIFYGQTERQNNTRVAPIAEPRNLQAR